MLSGAYAAVGPYIPDMSDGPQEASSAKQPLYYVQISLTFLYYKNSLLCDLHMPQCIKFCMAVLAF